MPFSKQNIRIAVTRPDLDPNRSALVSKDAPGLAIVRREASWWEITHIPSGKLVVHSVPTLRAAKHAVIELGKLVDTTLPEVEFIRAVRSQEEVTRPIIQRARLGLIND